MKIVVAWMSAFVFSVLASEQEVYKGDLGELILELVLNNTLKSLNQRDFYACLCTSKAIAKLCAAKKTEHLKLVHDELITHLKKNEILVSNNDIVVSPKFPAIGYRYIYNAGGDVVFYCGCVKVNKKNEFVHDSFIFRPNQRNVMIQKPKYIDGGFIYNYYDRDAQRIYSSSYISCINKR